MMPVTVVTPPDTMPVSLADMKDHLRVTHELDDIRISGLIIAATNQAERRAEHAFVERTLLLALDSFPDMIKLPYPPLMSVESIQYVDGDGTLTTLDSTKYRVDTQSMPGRIAPAYSESWPSIRYVTNAVQVTYKAGYGTAGNVPGDARNAIKLIVQKLYDMDERDGDYLDKAIDSALNDYERWCA